MISLQNSCFADDLKQQIENQIADRVDIEQVAIIPSNGQRFFSANEVALESIDVLDNNSFKANIIDSAGRRHLMLGRFEEAVKVITAGEDLSPSHHIEESSLIIVNYPKSKYKNNYITSSEEVIGKEPKHKIQKGRVIAKNDLVNPTIVKKGSKVKILFAKGNLTIQTDAVAIENGGVGDFIKVRNVETNKMITAKVLNEETAVVGS